MIFLLIFITGFLVVHTLSKEFTLLEKSALAFPIGLGLSSFALFFFGELFHAASLNNLTISLLFIIAICVGVLVYLHKKNIRVFEKPKFSKPDLKWFNLVWAVFAGMTAYLVWGITMKGLYFPPAEFDTIEGYDLLSKAIAREGLLANSILTNKAIVAGCGPRLLYPPLLAFSNSICYMLGMDTPKIINSLFFVSFPFLFYALLRRFVGSVSAIFFTFFMVITPEMFAHGSFALTNYPCAIYTSSAVLSMVIWYEKRIAGFLPLSALLMAFGLWTRTDVVMVEGALLLASLFILVKEKNAKPLLFLGAAFGVFVLWNLYSKAVIPKEQTSFFIKHLFWSSEKLGKVFSTAWGELMSSTQLYGWTFWFFVWALLVNIPAIIKKDNWFFLSILFVALGGYTLLYYQMNDDGTLFTNGGWMLSGYKRGLFVYVPLVLAYAALSKNVNWVFSRIQNALTFE